MIISIFTFIALLTYPIQILPSKKVVNRCDFMYFDERKRSFFLVIFRLDAGLESFSPKIANKY